MRTITHLWPLESVKKDGKITISAMIEQQGRMPFCLWFRVPAQRHDDLSKTSEPFVLASIFNAMKTSTKLIVHGQVSPSLLRNLEEFQDLWINWRPDKYAKIDIVAASEREPDNSSHPEKAVMAFSGGLDSCFTAFRHRTGSCGRQKRNLLAGVMVHGFDIPLKDKETFNRAAEKTARLLKSLDMEFIPIATNFRAMGDDWENAHSAAIGACLMLLQNSFGCGLIAGSFSYDDLKHMTGWGSNPLTDGFLSSNSFKIINDGSIFTRTDKLRHIAGWSQALENMRVCWEGQNLDSNCCKCEKCIRNILCFRALEINPSKCFRQDITNKQIENVRIPDFSVLFLYKNMLTEAKNKGITASWVKSLEKCIKRNERLLNDSAISWKKIRETVALRTRLRNFYRNSFSRQLAEV